MLIHEKDYTSRNLQIGQTYWILIAYDGYQSRHKKRKKAKLIGQTKYFFTFEWNTGSSAIKETISKFDWYKNPDIIHSACCRRRTSIFLIKRCYRMLFRIMRRFINEYYR